MEGLYNRDYCSFNLNISPNVLFVTLTSNYSQVLSCRFLILPQTTGVVHAYFVH